MREHQGTGQVEEAVGGGSLHGDFGGWDIVERTG